jgi:hypothetical protein
MCSTSGSNYRRSDGRVTQPLAERSTVHVRAGKKCCVKRSGGGGLPGLGRIRGKPNRWRGTCVVSWAAISRAPTPWASWSRPLESAYSVSPPDELRTFLEPVHDGGPGPGCDGQSINFPAVSRVRAALPFSYGGGDAQDLLARRHMQRYATSPLLGPEFGGDDDWPAGPGFIPRAYPGCGKFSVP